MKFQYSVFHPALPRLGSLPKALTAVALILVSACSTTTTPPAASAKSTAAPAADSTPATTTAYAVIVHNFLTDAGSTYTLALVGADGRTAATVNATKRSAASWFQVSSLSTSSTRVYYLDGNADVRIPEARRQRRASDPACGTHRGCRGLCGKPG